jgi:hypothetical protein
VCRSLCLPQGTKIIYWVRLIRSACLSGSCAGLASTAALAMAARTEGNAAVRPINATSHWLNGNSARSYQGFDAAHTTVGFLTNHIASIFWATFFDAWRARRAPVGPLPMLRDAMIMSAIAAAVDYGATPKRFTPGMGTRGVEEGYGHRLCRAGIGAMCWCVVDAIGSPTSELSWRATGSSTVIAGFGRKRPAALDMARREVAPGQRTLHIDSDPTTIRNGSYAPGLYALEPAPLERRVASGYRCWRCSGWR